MTVTGVTGIENTGCSEATIRSEHGNIVVEGYRGAVRVCNATGATVYRSTANGATERISLPNGLYVVSLDMADGVHSVKVMVE